MGYLGIDLKVSTAIIFTISFGIAEDDTIHMLAALRHHLRSGLSPAYALKRTYLRTGKAVTVTSFMLLSGFVTLVFSDFASVTTWECSSRSLSPSRSWLSCSFCRHWCFCC